MKVLGLVGSPRKNSNTDLLVSAVLYGAGANNHEIEKLFLYDIDISPCVDCRGCKKRDFQCVLKDGMKQLYPKLEEADVIIFGTPLYWYGPTAKMKLMLDRLRPYIASKKLRGKKAILIVPSEEGSEACNHLVGMFEASLKYIEVDLVGKVLAQSSEKAEIRKQPKILDEAFEIGKALK
jgi:multimeric flavodoxin WrbA